MSIYLIDILKCYYTIKTKSSVYKKKVTEVINWLFYYLKWHINENRNQKISNHSQLICTQSENNVITNFFFTTQSIQSEMPLGKQTKKPGSFLIESVEPSSRL